MASSSAQPSFAPRLYQLGKLPERSGAITSMQHHQSQEAQRLERERSQVAELAEDKLEEINEAVGSDSCFFYICLFTGGEEV